MSKLQDALYLSANMPGNYNESKKGVGEMSHNIFIILSVTFIVLSIACQIMIGVLLQNMINETDNMTTTDNKLLKQCKLKFMNCYRLNGGVSNVQIFADKFINRLKIGKISVVALHHLAGQMVLLSVFIAGVGIYFGITGNDSILNLMPYYIISFLGLYLYFSVSSAVDLPGKKKILKTNLVDYLENHMISHLEKVPASVRELEEKENPQKNPKETSDTRLEKDIWYEEDYLEVERDRPADSRHVITGGSREKARERAMDSTRSSRMEKNDFDQWQNILKNNLSDEELQALLSEFLA